MEINIINSAAQNIAYRLNQYANKEGIEFTKMVIGIEIFLINISKLAIVYLIAIILGSLVQTIIVHGAYVLIKRHSFGLHALNSTVCTVVSYILFAIVPWLLSGVTVGNGVIFVVFPLIILSLYLFAPADTKARPIIGSKIRTRLKWKSIFCGMLLMIATLLVPSEAAKFLMTLGAAYQIVSILPLTYKILKRSEKNYEQYEKHA